jgi:hypothetical protein
LEKPEEKNVGQKNADLLAFYFVVDRHIQVTVAQRAVMRAETPVTGERVRVFEVREIILFPCPFAVIPHIDCCERDFKFV